MAKNEAKIRFTAETGGFNSEIKKSNESMSELRAELKLNETQMKATGATVEGLENKHKILTAQLAASESKTQALSQKVDKAAEIFGENSTEVNKLRTQLLNAQTAEEKIRQAINTCNGELESQRNAANQAESATEKLTSTIDKQQSELDKLKKEYTDAVLENGKYSKEARTLAKEIDSLSDELDSNSKRMAEVESAADKLDNSLDNVDETAEAVSEGFSVMKGAMADLVADGIEAVVSGFGEIVESAFALTNDIDKATNTFVAMTGESADKAEEFEDVMVNIYNGNYGESFEDIADSMATVKTTMGDIGTADLESLTTQAIVLRDTFDMDVNESIRAVNSLMDQFGITGDEAYSLIAQGAQNGLNQNGDLLDVVNEYSVQFKDAGYSADDMFNMLANGTEAGVWSVDKLGDAVKEFNIRASDGTVSEAIKENAKAFGLSKTEAKSLAEEVESGSVESYKKLADTLRGVDDDTQRYQLGVSLFGTMWEDLGEDAVLAMLDTQGEISTTKDALGEINAVKYDDIGSAIGGIKRNLETSIAEPIKENVMPAVNEFIEDVDWQGVGQTIGEAFGTVVEGAIALVDAVKQTVQWMNEHKAVVIAVASVIGVLATAITAYNVVQGIKTAMDAANVTTVWALVAAHIAQAAAAMAAIAPYILIVAAIAAVIAIIVLCVKYWDEIVAAVKKCWDACCATLATWGEWINTNVIQPVVGFFTGLWDGIVGIFQSVVDWVKTNWKSIVLFLINPFYGVFNYLYTNFEGFRNFIDNIVENIKQFFVDLWDGIKAAWDGICNAVSTAINAVKNVITTVMNAIKSFFTTVWNAIKTAISTVVNAIKTTITTVWNAIKTATSTAFNAVKNTATNVWNAIKTAISTVVNGVKTTVSGVWNGIKTATSNVFNGIKTTATTVWNNIKTAITKPIEAARDKVKDIIDKIKGFFSGLKLELPKIKLPHFKITGSFSINPPSVPKLGIEWYKDGGIMMKPTIFGMNGNSLMAGGEAGPEAILPIDRLEGYISNAIEKAQNVVNLDTLAAAIEDLASRTNVIRIGDRDVAVATASANDSVSGLRSKFKGRGLVLG